MRRVTFVVAVVVSMGVGAAALAAATVRPQSKAVQIRAAYDPFAMSRAVSSGPGNADYNKAVKRLEVTKKLKDKVKPPHPQPPRSPHKPDMGDDGNHGHGDNEGHNDPDNPGNGNGNGPGKPGKK